jgi:hypothetical protein
LTGSVGINIKKENLFYTFLKLFYKMVMGSKDLMNPTSNHWFAGKGDRYGTRKYGSGRKEENWF